MHRARDKSLGLPELIAIGLGGMVGGGIFSVLGVAVALVGVFTPLAIFLGGLIAGLAAYSYIKLAVYYQDEGATYSFFKKTFPGSPFAASLIGWWVIFGYIATMALYAYTFASYTTSGFGIADNVVVKKLVAGAIILLFMLVNIWSVKGMGKIEDLMVYSKLIILVVISFVLANNGSTTLSELVRESNEFSIVSILIVASLTFVAYEGFQLIINATAEMERPQINIPRAIYSAIGLAIFIYVIIALGALLAIPFEDLIENEEYALAAGAADVLGEFGRNLVIVGAMLATSSAISGTAFGASRQMAVIASDGFFPAILGEKRNQIPIYSIVAMSATAFLLVLIGNLQVILEFGSVTFLLVSFLMAYANYCMRDKTESSATASITACIALLLGIVCILYYEFANQPEQLFFIIMLYLILTIAAWLYSQSGRKLQQKKY